jgi:hypothetical protein
MSNIVICIPSRNRTSKLQKLYLNLLSYKFNLYFSIHIIETVSNTAIESYSNVLYEHIPIDISFGDKIYRFAKKYKGKYVLFLSDDDKYDFSSLFEILKSFNDVCDEKLYLYKIFDIKNKFYKPGELFYRGKLPFYLISTYIFKCNYAEMIDKDSIWIQNYLLHSYYVEDFSLISSTKEIVHYIEGDGFGSIYGIKSFYKTLDKISNYYGYDVAPSSYYSEYRHTQRMIAKKILLNKQIERDVLDYFSKFLSFNYRDISAYLIIKFKRIF